MLLARRHWTSSIGVDVGHDAIKVMQLEEREGVLSVLAAGKERFPAEIRQDERWSYRRYRYTVDALRALLRRGAFRGRWANLALGGEALAVGSVRLGLGTYATAEIAAAAREQLGLGTGASVSYVAAGPIREAMGCREAFLTFGAEEQVLSDLLAMLAEAGLKCRSIEPNVCAIQQCFTEPVDNHGRFHVIVDMGQQTTTIALSCGGQLRWARQTALGGGQLTQKVAAKLNLDWDQAEALRWQWREDQADAGCLDQQVERMLDDLARDLVEELADELEECFRQGQASMPAADGGEVIFTGGEARPPLVTLLHERISQPVQVGHALENLDATSGQENPCPSEPQGGWAVTLGLCLLERARAHDEVPV